MKKTILFSMLFIVATTSFSQQNNPAPTLTKQDYLSKSKNQKTGAWLLLSGGFIMTAIGTGLAIDDASAAANDLGNDLVYIFTLGSTVPVVNNDKDNSTLASVLVLTGLGSMVGSIPLFSAAEKNKRRGMKLTFSNQKIPSFQKTSFVYQTIPSLKLKINL